MRPQPLHTVSMLCLCICVAVWPQVVLSNIHVRYEDDEAWPGHTLAGGVLLRRAAVHTVDEEGRTAFVTMNVMQLLRKVGPCTLEEHGYTTSEGDNNIQVWNYGGRLP